MNKCDGIKILELDPKRILEGKVAGMTYNIIDEESE